MELVQEVGPAGAVPPAGWAKTTGRQAYERCHPMVAIVLYAKVQLRTSVVRPEY